MKLIFPDIIFLITLFMLIGAHVTTNFMIKHYEQEAEVLGIAKENVLLMEANPLARVILGLDNFKFMFSYAILPALFSGLYWFTRRRYIDNRPALEAYAVAFFMLMLLDFTNDLSIVLGLFL